MDRISVVTPTAARKPAQAEHAHLANVRPGRVVRARPSSVVFRTSPLVRFTTVSNGRNEARLASAATPMCMKRTLVGDPTFLAR